MAPSPERKVRVGVVIPFYYPVFGGAENQCRALLHILTAGGEVEVPFLLTRRKEPDFAPQERVDGVRVIRLGPPGMSRLAHYLFYLVLLWRLLRLGRQVDLIHCHATSVTGFCATLAGRFLSKPVLLKLSSNGELVVGTRNQGGPDGGMKQRLRGALAGFLCRNAAMVALNREGLEELTQCNCRRSHCLPNGVDTGRFVSVGRAARSELRRKLGFPEEAVIFLFAGRFVVSKGMDLLLAAFDQLAGEAAGRDALLCLVGSGEGQAESVEAEVSRRIGSQVQHQPPVSDVSPLLQAADVFVFPSRREGLPNAVLEALAVGLPCILSDIDPHRELAATNPAAAIRFFPSGDASALAAAMREACREVREGRRTGRPLVSQLGPDYRLDVVAHRYLDLYRELIDEQS